MIVNTRHFISDAELSSVFPVTGIHPDALRLVAAFAIERFVAIEAMGDKGALTRIADSLEKLTALALPAMVVTPSEASSDLRAVEIPREPGTLVEWQQTPIERLAAAMEKIAGCVGDFGGTDVVFTHNIRGIE